MSKRIHESGTVSVDPTTKALRVCLISEGKGSSADYPRDFFTQANADALGGSLSFPNHPIDLNKPHLRDPMSAIGHISESVVIEEHDGLLSFWGDYVPAASKPEVGPYLAEFGHKLGISIYADSDGHTDTATGRWVAESLDGGDPYKSVDLVVAAGARGKFEKVSESLGLLPNATATAEEKNEETPMDKDIEERFNALTKVVEGLVAKLDGTEKAAAQVEADETAVNKAVESRLTAYKEADELILAAKLTESQTASLRARAMDGVDITKDVEDAKKILAEAKALAGDPGDDENPGSQRVSEHLGDRSTSDWDVSVAGFGQVA